MPTDDTRAQGLEQEILWSLHHEDHLGLWEIAWMLDISPGQDEVAVDAEIALARAVTWDLLDRGAIEVWELDGWPPRAARPMPVDEFRSVADEPEVWTRPEDARRLIEVRAVDVGGPV